VERRDYRAFGSATAALSPAGQPFLGMLVQRRGCRRPRAARHRRSDVGKKSNRCRVAAVRTAENWLVRSERSPPTTMGHRRLRRGLLRWALSLEPEGKGRRFWMPIFTCRSLRQVRRRHNETIADASDGRRGRTQPESAKCDVRSDGWFPRL